MIAEINSALFTFDNYEAAYGDALGLSYNAFTVTPELEDSELHQALGKYAVGYCKGERLSVRPRRGAVGIMCEKDGERFWFHIQESTLDCLQRKASSKAVQKFAVDHLNPERAK